MKNGSRYTVMTWIMIRKNHLGLIPQLYRIVDRILNNRKVAVEILFIFSVQKSGAWHQVDPEHRGKRENNRIKLRLALDQKQHFGRVIIVLVPTRALSALVAARTFSLSVYKGKAVLRFYVISDALLISSTGRYPFLSYYGTIRFTISRREQLETTQEPQESFTGTCRPKAKSWCSGQSQEAGCRMEHRRH